VNGGFCRLTPDSKLIVTVKNQGAGPAGPSTTQVTFNSGSVSLPTPALAPGASIDLFFQVPAGCFRPDCGFRITVDAASVVIETNEANNVASGSCLG
jgi:subtilase family serine protease